MLQFPEWSDLGKITDKTRGSWENEISLRDTYRRYFDGSIFQDTVPVETGTADEAPLLYPVGVNLVKMLCTAQADSLFGEWEDQVVNYEADQDNVADATYSAAIELLNDLHRSSNLNTVLWEIDMDRQVYGGGVLKIMPSLNTRGYIRWQRVPLDSFFPIFDPDNPDELLEAYTVVKMTPEQARIKYGIDKPSGEIVTRVEHWTPILYENMIDGKRIEAYSGHNPWGFVPYVYIPRIRTTNWWGDALTQEIMPAQDEINMRLADLGEAISYSAHPTRWGINLPRVFNAKNFPIGYNAMWDLGRTLGNNPAPQVGMLEAKNPLPEGVFNYLKFVYDWSRTSSFAPPIAFGEDNGGGQRSGVTLEIRMWPLIKATRRSRAYMLTGIRKAIWMTGVILAQKSISGIDKNAIMKMVDGKIVPTIAPVMPRDHQQIVDEVVKLLSTDPPSISIETAQKILGRGTGEVDRIVKMLSEKGLWKPQPVTNNENNPEDEDPKSAPGGEE